MREYPKREIRLVQLELGTEYTVWWEDDYYGWRSKPMTCRLIKPTQKGYNFLNLDTHKCILKRHIYPSKYPEHFNQMMFFVSAKLKCHESK